MCINRLAARYLESLSRGDKSLHCSCGLLVPNLTPASNKEAPN